MQAPNRETAATALRSDAVRILHASAVFDGTRSHLDAAIVVDGLRVLDVGRASDVLPRHQGLPVDNFEGVLFPGTVNAHTHLELSALAGRVVAGLGFLGWVDAMMHARTEVRESEVQEAIVREINLLRRRGTVAIAEVTNSLASVIPLIESRMMTCIMHEYFGLSLAGMDHALLAMAQGASRLPEAPWMHYARVPHALHTTHPRAVQRLVQDARTARALLSVHLAEHAGEREVLLSGSGEMAEWLSQRTGIAPAQTTMAGVGPIARAEQLGLLGPATLLVHLTNATDAELAQVAACGASVVLCLRSNQFIEGRVPNVQTMHSLGIEPALGTDSLASCGSLSVIDEARFGWMQLPQLPADFWLKAATASGARALARADAPAVTLGSLAIGLAPGIVWTPGPVTSGAAEHVLLNAGAERLILEAQVS